MTLNVEGHHPRADAGQRPAREPPPHILELGHFVRDHAEHQKTIGWYTEPFGPAPGEV
ncbi:hypothetical protein AB0D91_45155 [Streptomyces canus]|uniref:hypothetical protein n=1 Tax=Streptomyces canus TaxID=58343 RepID=UPI0033C5C644